MLYYIVFSVQYLFSLLTSFVSTPNYNLVRFSIIHFNLRKGFCIFLHMLWWWWNMKVPN